MDILVRFIKVKNVVIRNNITTSTKEIGILYKIEVNANYMKQTFGIIKM